MATTPTNKPIPSEDPRDLKFNAGKVDEEVNGSADYYTDRFSVQRLTNTGRNNQFQDAQTQREYDFVASQADKEARYQQFLLSSGYQFLGDYENGPYTITARNQIIRYQNEFWRLNASTNPPYTTTGVNSTSWTVDVTHLVSVGDATLRQELGSSTSGIVALPSSGFIEDAIKFVTPEMFASGRPNIHDRINAAANYAKNNGVVLTGNGKQYVVTGTVILDGINVRDMTIKGSGNINVECYSVNLTNITFDGTRARFKGGKIQTKACRHMNVTATSAITGHDLTADMELYMYEPYFENCTFGYLRNRTGQLDNIFKVTKTIVGNLSSKNMKGDVFNCNLTQIDGPVILYRPQIPDCQGDGTSGTFLGLAISFAGMTNYDPYADDSLYVRDVTIIEPKISGSRQCLHFEKCKNVKIYDVDLTADNSVNTSAGFSTHGVVFYGCDDVLIDGGNIECVNGIGTAIGLRWGLVGGVYSGPTRNITIRNIKKVKGNLIAYSAADDTTLSSTVNIENISRLEGQFLYKGYASQLTIRNILAISDTTHTVEINHTTGEGAGIMHRYKYICARFENLDFLDTTGAPNASFVRITADDIFASGVRASIAKSAETVGWRGPLMVRSPGNIRCPSTAFPYGPDFTAGTVLIKSDGSGGWRVTSYGAGSPATDTIRATTVGQTYIESSNLDWLGATGQKQAGQKINIPGAGASGSTLTTSIVRGPYASGGFTRVDIKDAIQTATADGVIITPAVIGSFVSF